MGNRIIGKVAINPCGEWKEGSLYERLDFVTYRGNSYLCKKDTDTYPLDFDCWMHVSSSLTGKQGERGYQGQQGERGYRGQQGERGVQGDKGIQGDKGDIGVQGNRGAQGSQGYTGFQGTPGFQGSQGKQGSRGVQGNVGVGQQGVQGYQGNQGLTGARGFQGYKGDKGTTGEQGIRGYQGPQGKPGPQGTQGMYGYQGQQGSKGSITKWHSGTQFDSNETGSNIGKVGNTLLATYEVGDMYLNTITGHVYEMTAKSSNSTTSWVYLGNIKGNQGVQGYQGYQGNQGKGFIYVPQIGTNNTITYNCQEYKSNMGPQSIDLYFYGYTNSAYPEITDNFKDNVNGYITSKPSPTPVGTPITLMGNPGKATENMRYIWRRNINANINDDWELIDALYVATEVIFAKSISEVTVTSSLTYGSVVVDTDLQWCVFRTQDKGYGYNINDIGGLQFTPSTFIKEESGTFLSEGEISDSYIMTLERWDKLSTNVHRVLTTNEAIQQIYDSICKPNASTGFSWSQFINYYSNMAYPYIPICIKFANGLFTIQDIHEIKSKDDILTEMKLYGSLSIFCGQNSPTQGSHINLNRYALECGCLIELRANNGSSISLGYGHYNNTSNVMLTVLPLSH
ncbi:MAG: collagen-like protein [Lachnospiraceae bacterium]|nr:collagen-like protein [Lachnospiraceae bacterium]